ncbi:acyltransferase family protein [uncultured Pseudokineococcus sp.]|uniref:acyltransferase family protein n=1 Tax=uncultured Pseudokineococcus sp. TaxID=1642928 RepID=UPI0026292205|nr:acyltransferase family protein [uncultured Pseudokineococcus sp.]
MDTVRGLLVLAVVLGHVVMVVRIRGGVPEALDPVLLTLRMFRIQALFLLSGVLFASYLARPWRLVVRNRLLLLVQVLVVWLLVDRLVRARLLWDPPPGPVDMLQHVGEQLVLPDGELWFIWTMAVMALLARLLGRYRVALLAVFAVLASGVLPVPDLGPQTRAAMTAGPYFLLGAALGGPVLRRGTTFGPATGATAVVGLLLLAQAERHELLAPVPPALRVAVAVAVGGVATTWFARGLVRARVAAPLRGLGRRTLPVYVMHLPLVLVCLRWADEQGSTVAADRPHFAVALLAGLGIGVPVLLHALLERLDVHGVFDAPRWATTAVDRWSARPTRGRLSARESQAGGDLTPAAATGEDRPRVTMAHRGGA